jgi:hypothetical protein
MPKQRNRRSTSRRSATSQSQVSNQDRRILLSSLSSAPGGRSEVITRVLTKEATISSSAGGAITSIGTWDASTFADFATLAPLWDEWRPIGMEVIIQCSQAFSPPSATVSKLCVVVYDNDDASTALTSYGNALDYKVQAVFGTIWSNDHLVRMKANALNIADSSTGVAWQTTGTTQVNKAFKYYATGLSASQPYMDVCYRYVIQLRQPT